MSPVKSAWEKDTQSGTMRQVYPAMSYRRALVALIRYAHMPEYKCSVPSPFGRGSGRGAKIRQLLLSCPLSPTLPLRGREFMGKLQ